MLIDNITIIDTRIFTKVKIIDDIQVMRYSMIIIF